MGRPDERDLVTVSVSLSSVPLSLFLITLPTEKTVVNRQRIIYVTITETSPYCRDSG